MGDETVPKGAEGDTEAAGGKSTPPNEGRPSGDASPPGEGAPAPSDRPAAVTYEFKVPEGFELSDDRRAALTALATEGQLPPAVAQKFVDEHVKALTAGVQRAMEQEATAAQARWESWVNETKALGQETVEKANRAFARFGGPAMAKLLETKGVDTYVFDNPAVVQLFAAIQDAIADSPTHREGTRPADAPVDDRQLFYGDKKK